MVSILARHRARLSPGWSDAVSTDWVPPRRFSSRLVLQFPWDDGQLGAYLDDVLTYKDQPQAQGASSDAGEGKQLRLPKP